LGQYRRALCSDEEISTPGFSNCVARGNQSFSSEFLILGHENDIVLVGIGFKIGLIEMSDMAVEKIIISMRELP
jgi:hypothetical protein